jgi:Apea-like HEPN
MDQRTTRKYTSRLMACLSFHGREQSPPFEQDALRIETLASEEHRAFVLDLNKYETFRRHLLEEENWGEKFTEEYIDKELRRLFLFRRLKEEGDNTKALHHFTELVNKIENYAQKHIVYVPLSGIQLDVDPFSIGNVTLRRTEALYEDLAKKLEDASNTEGRTKEQIHHSVSLWLKDLKESSVCAEYWCIAEPNRVDERAEEECQRIFDLFRYSIHMMGRDGYRIAIGRRGDASRFIRSTPIISLDGQRFSVFSRVIGPLALFHIEPDSIARMEQFGVFKVAEILKRKIEEKSFGEILLRGLHWFSNAQIQIVKENQYLNLTSCLETFLTSGDSNDKISNSVAEGVAFVLKNEREERKELKKKVKTLYDKRSRVSHGGHSAITTSDLEALKTIVGDFLYQMIQRMDHFQTRKDLDEWLEDQKFG